MIPKKETEKIEFKKTISELKESVISLSSMLNKNNEGIVYFGVKNNGDIFGQEIGEFTTSKILNEIKNYIKPTIYPKIEILKLDDKNIIKVEVNGNDTPYSAYGRYYKRCDDQDLEMTQKELEYYFLNKNITYAEWENKITKYGIEDIDENLLIDYVDKANEVNRMNYRYKDSEDALIKLGLLENGKLNNAGYYLFSNRKPLMLKLAIFASDERLTFIDNKQFFGNIFECINEGIKYVANNIHYSAQIKGIERVETPEIPLVALREIIVNSFAHMKVTPGEYNEIIITPNKVRIYNPGTIVLNKDPLEFASGKIGSKIRNPLIALTLYKNKTIEEFGTGFKRVFNLCNKVDIKYNYGSDEFGFYFEFLRNKVSNTVKENVTNNDFTILENKIINYIFDNKIIHSVNEVAHLFDRAPITIKRSLYSLANKGLIERVGSKKTGYWRIKH